MDLMDEYLGKRLQNWAAKNTPPVNGKVRLLRAASQAAYSPPRQASSVVSLGVELLGRLLKLTHYQKRPQDYSPKFYDWTLVYSFELSLVNLRLMF
jgi:hypothetical protein